MLALPRSHAGGDCTSERSSCLPQREERIASRAEAVVHLLKVLQRFPGRGHRLVGPPQRRRRRTRRLRAAPHRAAADFPGQAICAGCARGACSASKPELYSRAGRRLISLPLSPLSCLDMCAHFLPRHLAKAGPFVRTFGRVRKVRTFFGCARGDLQHPAKCAHKSRDGRLRGREMCAHSPWFSGATVQHTPRQPVPDPFQNTQTE